MAIAAARRIRFQFNDGRTSEFDLAGAPDIGVRIAAQCEGPCPSASHFVYPTRADAKQPAQQRHAEIDRVLRDQFCPGLPTVLVPDFRVRILAEKTLDGYLELSRLLAGRANVVYFPALAHTSRKLCEYCGQFISCRPALMVLGFGLEDYASDPQYNHQSYVDLVEFEYRLDWVLETAVQYAGIKLVIVCNSPVGESGPDAKGRHFSAAKAEPYMEEIRRASRTYGQGQFDAIAYCLSEQLVTQHAWLSPMLKDLADTIVARLTSP